MRPRPDDAKIPRGKLMFTLHDKHLRSSASRLALALVVWFNFTAACLGAEFKAVLDRATIGLGETVTLNLVFENCTPTALSQLPVIKDLDFIAGPSQSSQFNNINGVTKALLTISYTLKPQKQGEFQIPAFDAVVDGQHRFSQPLTLKVGEPVTATVEAAAGNLAFIRLVLPRTEVYVGEMFPVEIQLYLLVNPQDTQPQVLVDGFSLGKMIQAPSATTVLNNQRYQVALLRMSATAAKVGDLQFGPAECEMKLQVPSGRFGFFQNYDLRPVHLRSPTQTVKVLPLPVEGRPANFNGAVGDFSLAFNAGPTNLTAGDPITVKLTISGRGPIESLVLPDQPQWQEFKSYPPSITTELTDETGTSGSRTFEQVLIPQSSMIKSLPPVQFSFFNPAQKQYVILASPEIPLNVSPGALTATPTLNTTNVATADKPKTAADIIHIRPRLEEIHGSGVPLITRTWFVAAQSVPVLAWMAMLVRRRRIEWLENNPRVRRRREVEARVHEGLGQMREQASAQRAEEFFATLFRVLQEQLGERLNLPASGITSEVIADRLRPLEVEEGTLAELAELFDACDQARFAPQHRAGELESLVPRTEAVLQALQEVEA